MDTQCQASPGTPGWASGHRSLSLREPHGLGSPTCPAPHTPPLAADPRIPGAKRPPALPPAQRGHLRAIMQKANVLIGGVTEAPTG